MATNIDSLRTALSAYVEQITDALILARARVKLDEYIDALTAFANINRSAAASYSDVRGTVSKRLIDQAREARDLAWRELTDLLAQGGIDVPQESSISYWSFGDGFA